MFTTYEITSNSPENAEDKALMEDVNNETLDV